MQHQEEEEENPMQEDPVMTYQYQSPAEAEARMAVHYLPIQPPNSSTPAPALSSPGPSGTPGTAVLPCPGPLAITMAMPSPTVQDLPNVQILPQALSQVITDALAIHGSADVQQSIADRSAYVTRYVTPAVAVPAQPQPPQAQSVVISPGGGGAGDGAPEPTQQHTHPAHVNYLSYTVQNQ